MVVINLLGAPGAGKSTGAAYVFAMLKMKGINAELITEFAKDKTWESNASALACQPYMFGKQLYRQERCRGSVDVIVTDSPLLLSILYDHLQLKDKKLTKVQQLQHAYFDRSVELIFKENTNLNFFLTRVKPYNPVGRNQTEEESNQLSEELHELLKDYEVEFEEVPGCLEGYNIIVDKVVEALSNG